LSKAGAKKRGVLLLLVPSPLTLKQGIAQEVQNRLAAAGVRGRALTLKVKRRQIGAPEPAKFLGHGPCDSSSRSVTLAGYLR
jgi:hypothetical protein